MIKFIGPRHPSIAGQFQSRIEDKAIGVNDTYVERHDPLPLAQPQMQTQMQTPRTTPFVEADPATDPVLRRLMRRPPMTQEEIEAINSGGATLLDVKKPKAPTGKKA